MSRKPKRPLSACDKAKLKHMNSEVDPKKYDPLLDLDKNNNMNKIGKKRPEINRSISLTSSYEKRNLITNSLPPSKSLDNQLTAGKKPMAFHFKNLKKFRSKLPHLQTVQPTSATSLSSANQPTKLASTKASSFDTTILMQPRNSLSPNGQLTSTAPNSIRTTPNLLSLRPRSVSDCSNCTLGSQVHLAHRAQHEFIKVIKRDREFIKWLRRPAESGLCDGSRAKESRGAGEKPSERLVETTKQTGQTTDGQSAADKSNQSETANAANSQAKEELMKIDGDIKRLSSKRAAKLNIGDVVRRFREKHRQQFPERAPINPIKAAAICIDDYAFSWCPPGLNGEQASREIVPFNFARFRRIFTCSGASETVSGRVYASQRSDRRGSKRTACFS